MNKLIIALFVWLPLLAHSEIRTSKDCAQFEGKKICVNDLISYPYPEVAYGAGKVKSISTNDQGILSELTLIKTEDSPSNVARFLASKISGLEVVDPNVTCSHQTCVNQAIYFRGYYGGNVDAKVMGFTSNQVVVKVLETANLYSRGTYISLNFDQIIQN